MPFRKPPSPQKVPGRKPIPLDKFRKHLPTWEELSSEAQKLGIKRGYLIEVLVRYGVVDKHHYYPKLVAEERARRHAEVERVFHAHFRPFIRAERVKKRLSDDEVEWLTNSCHDRTVKAIDQYLTGQGTKFSTYLIGSWKLALKKCLRMRRQKKYMTRSQSLTRTVGEGHEVLVTDTEDYRNWRREERDESPNLPPDARHLLKNLTATEFQLMDWRFGLSGRRPMTLPKIAKRKKWTKDVARRTVERIIHKMRLEIPPEKD